MSKLYNLASDIITSSSLDEAENKLFGSNGIRINSEEYFENIVSDFIRKKEHIIRKENDNLVFNLNDYNDIWNIIFLGEYIKENDVLYKEYNNLLLEIDNIKHNLEIVKSQHRNVNTREEHERINEEYQSLKAELDNKNEIKDNYKNVIDTFYKINWVKLENTNDDIEKQEAAELLKQSINIIHKLRNSFQHGRGNISRHLEINDDSFNVSIPIEYLDGFNKGRIIVNEEDKIIVERTNLIASPLLESLDYDVRKVGSFFYNVNPEYLSFLLEQVDYNYDELYKLKPVIFYREELVKTFLRNGYSLSIVNTFPDSAFPWKKNPIELFKRNIDIYKLPYEAFNNPTLAIKLYNAGIDLYKLPGVAFNNLASASAIKLYNAGIDIYKLPKVAFVNLESTLMLNEAGIDIYKLPEVAFFHLESTLMLNEAGIDIYKLPRLAFENLESSIELKEAGIDIYKLPERAFNNPTSAIELHDAGIDIYKLVGTEDDEYSYPALKDVMELDNAGIDIYKLPYEAFNNPTSVIELYDAGIDIYKLPYNAFFDLKSVFELCQKEIDIYNLADKEGKDCFHFPSSKDVMELVKAGIDIYKLPIEAVDYPETTLMLNEVGIDIYKLPYFVFNNPELAIELKEAGIDIYKLPNVAFKHPESVIELKEAGIDIYKLPSEAFHNFDYILDFYSEGIDIYRLPWNKIYRDVNVDNVEYLLNLVHGDYDKLETFPVEFFKCDISLIDEMYQTYNSNVARSIFGINNPKIIATLLYCNSVFRKYQKENNDSDIIDFAPINFMKLGAGATFQFKNNITDLEMDSKTYLNQFVLDYDGNYRNARSIKNNILDKLRNSTCHFRFKLVKDQNGKIMEDKIYLYDRFNDSSDTNFNMILDIQDLVETARSIELVLEKKNTIVDREEQEKDTVHRNK